jgi:hypothetical protein
LIIIFYIYLFNIICFASSPSPEGRGGGASSKFCFAILFIPFLSIPHSFLIRNEKFCKALILFLIVYIVSQFLVYGNLVNSTGRDIFRFNAIEQRKFINIDFNLNYLKWPCNINIEGTSLRPLSCEAVASRQSPRGLCLRSKKPLHASQEKHPLRVLLSAKGPRVDKVRSYSTSVQLRSSPHIKEEFKLDPYFVTGLTESEGSFSIIKNRDIRAKFGMTVRLRFKITMLVNETVLIKKVQAFYGVGSIYIDEKRGAIDYIVSDKAGLRVIKDHFIKYPLRGSKYLDFLDFLQALELMEQNLHRTDEGFNLLVSLSEGMNSLRKDYSKMPPVHTIKDNLDYIPLDGNYINGFIAGDGCLFLKTKSNFGTMGIQISQHVNNSALMKEILDFFKLDSKVYSHGAGKKSVQITLGGKKV